MPKISGWYCSIPSSTHVDRIGVTGRNRLARTSRAPCATLPFQLIYRYRYKLVLIYFTHFNVITSWSERATLNDVPERLSRTRRMLTACDHFVPRAAVSWRSNPSPFAVSVARIISFLPVKMHILRPWMLAWWWNIYHAMLFILYVTLNQTNR